MVAATCGWDQSVVGVNHDGRRPRAGRRRAMQPHPRRVRVDHVGSEAAGRPRQREPTRAHLRQPPGRRDGCRRMLTSTSGSARRGMWAASTASAKGPPDGHATATSCSRRSSLASRMSATSAPLQALGVVGEEDPHDDPLGRPARRGRGLRCAAVSRGESASGSRAPVRSPDGANRPDPGTRSGAACRVGMESGGDRLRPPFRVSEHLLIDVKHGTSMRLVVEPERCFPRGSAHAGEGACGRSAGRR